MNTDANIVSEVGVGLGAVLRDDSGAPVAAKVKRLKARWSVEQAEVEAVKYGMQLANRLGFAKVLMECDAVTVVQAINNNYKGYSPLLLCYEDIARMKLSFDTFQCSHVRRAGNTLAHLVARWSTNEMEFVCLDNFPQSLITLAELELL